MKTISFFNLSLIFLPLFFVWFYYYKWTNDKTDILISTLRMLIQLLIIGYLLVFIFKTDDIKIGIGILLFMLFVSSWITLRNTKDKSITHYKQIVLSVFVSSFINLLLIVYFILQLEKIYEPQYVIPIAGMVFASTMNALSLAIERFEKEIERTNFFEARKIAFKACMIPQINSLLAVGLVSLPGMMTGQILSGVDPLVAVRYQIMIMAMTLSSAGISSIVYFSIKNNKL
ncbi:hypothetical protein CP965_08925 [Halarcobacter mediterraneus]|uniref:ABC transporter permease n=1 Tax=Halarcobacter mediterraneus TaxID=2023153 RepID=A0A4Q1AYH0_9BACT|nr:ABC transporter permease [Halarcobacter mediterraneus]RXK12690.1 hypothetical protein CP965_08925 [Halarcobacter mediterraneus]